MAQVTSKELAIAVCKALADKRGKDIVALYVIISLSLAVATLRKSALWAKEWKSW